ncbi:hypothetical protein K0M31_000384, partial [Melipona bicolor]
KKDFSSEHLNSLPRKLITFASETDEISKSTIENRKSTTGVGDFENENSAEKLGGFT